MENISEKIVEFLNNNEVDFVVPGCYGLPSDVVIKAIKEFLEYGKSDLINKHKKWNWHRWDLDYLKNGSTFGNNLSLEDLIELKELKKFWGDNEDLDFLDEQIKIETKRIEIRKTYKFKRKEGFTEDLKEKCRKRDRYKCKKCESIENLEIDHKIELIDGGDNTLSNLQTLCKKCHRIKTDKEIKKRKK